MNPEISIIAAMDQERGIGKDGTIPWPRIPEDMKRFRDLTMHRAVIMGRKTWDSLDERFKPLPERYNIVVTKNNSLSFPDLSRMGQIGGFAYHFNIPGALNIADEVGGEIFIIGGGEIYRQTIDLASRLYLTLIDGDFKCDTFFPDYLSFNNIIAEEERQMKGLRYKFVTLEKEYGTRS